MSQRTRLILLLIFGLCLMAWSAFISTRLPSGNPLLLIALGAGFVGYSGFMLVQR